MKYLSHYKTFESLQKGVTTQQKILLDNSCEPYSKNNGRQIIGRENAWSINPKTGLVDVGGGFLLRKPWDNLLGIKFGRVNGDFDITAIGLGNPADLPREIEGNLNASHNKFRTLEGMGDVKGVIDLSNNLLISLEGISEVSAFKDPKSRNLPLLFTSKIQVSGNPVRAPYLLDDLEEVLEGKTTWMRIYLEILTGDLDIKKDKEESIQWILDNKIDPKILGEEIKKNPEKMSVLIGRIPREYRKIIDSALSQIDLPSGFSDDKDLISSLGDVGL